MNLAKLKQAIEEVLSWKIDEKTDYLKVISIDNQVFAWRTRTHETIQEVSFSIVDDKVKAIILFLDKDGVGQERVTFFNPNLSVQSLCEEIKDWVNPQKHIGLCPF